MDIATIIGVLLGFIVITTSIVVGGGWQIFIHVPSMAITIGGMLCATLIHFSLPQFLKIFSIIKKTIITKIPTQSELIQKMVNFAAINRRDGALALEQEIPKVSSPFFVKGMQMLIDGQSPDAIRDIMFLEIQYLQERHSTGKKIAAVGEYKKLLEKMPNNISALNNMAYMLADNDKELDKALAYAERANNLAPDRADIMDTYAYVLYRNGKYQQAVEVQRSAVQIFEQGQAAAPPEIYHHLGMMVEKLGGHTEALAAYKQAMELGKNKLSPKDRQLAEEAIERLSRQQESETSAE